VFWTLGAALIIAIGLALLFNVNGAASALWGFWSRRWSDGRRVYGNPLFVRLWFGVLCLVIGAVWIYAGS